MNRKLNFVRFILAVTLGAILWAGCASQPKSGLKILKAPEPVDLTKHDVYTHPERLTGLDTFR